MNKFRNGIYQHYKGLLYLVIGVARHSETDEKMVVYVPLGVKVGPRIAVRPYDMFRETVVIDGIPKPRFEYIGEEVPQELADQFDPLAGYSGTTRDND